MTSSEGDHAANGLAEVGVREIKAHEVVLRDDDQSSRALERTPPTRSAEGV